MNATPSAVALARYGGQVRVEDGEDEEAKPSEATIVVEFHHGPDVSIVVGCDHMKASTISRWHVMS